MSFDYFSKSRMQYILTKLKVILDAKAVPGDIKNGTLTIQKNGTNVQTFSANQSSNATANITVPTKTSDLTNDSGFTTNTGTVTSVSAGVGLAGGPVTGSGSLKAKLKSETKLTNDSTAATETTGRIYPVVQDKTGYLAVVVPWENTHTITGVKGNAESSYRTGNVNITPANIGLGNVGNFKAVSTVASQGLTDTEKSNARANIGAGTGNGTITGIKMNGASKGTSGVVDLGTVITAHQDISGKADKSATVSTVAWDSTNKKITKTINGTTTDVVSAATILGNLTSTQVTTALGYTPSQFSGSYNDLTNKPTIPAAVAVKGNAESSYRTGNVNITAANIGLGNVGNFKAVSTVASQGLTDTEKSNARANIGAGTSSFSGSYNDLTNKPTIPTVNNATLTIQKNGTNVQTFTANQSTNATANITVPTKTSDLTNDSGFVTTDNDHRKVFYANCETAASERAKVATLSNSDGWELKAGTMVVVKYKYSNTYAPTAISYITLNINNSGAKMIVCYGNNLPMDASNIVYGWQNYACAYVYNGTSWEFVGSSIVPLSLEGGTMTGRITSPKPNNFLVTGSGTAAQDKGSGVSPRYFPAKWTFNTGKDPVDGDIITIKIPCAGHDYGVFVSINNGTSYHPVRVDYGTGRLTTHYGNGQYIMLVYTPNSTCNKVYAAAGANDRSNITGCWTVLNYYNTNTDIRAQAYCDTAAGTAAKVASSSGYKLRSGNYILLNLVNANSSATALTLNVNGTGAKAIYINGSASSASNYTLPAGTYIVYYNGTNYYFRTDGKITGAGMVDIAGNTGKFLRGDGTWQTPANDNNKVTQTPDDSTNSDFELLFSNSANNTSETNQVRKSSGLTYNPSSKELTLTSGSNNTHGLKLIESPVDASKANNNVESVRTYTLPEFKDSGERIVGGVESSVWSSGSIETSIFAKNYDTSGGNISTGGLSVYAGKDGTISYNVSDDAAFRNAIGNPETKVTQTPSDSSNADYEVLFSNSANNNSETAGVKKSNGLIFNPYYRCLKVKDLIVDTTLTNNGVTEDLLDETYGIYDKNNRLISMLEAVSKPNGEIGTYVQAVNYNSEGNRVLNGIGMFVDKNGNRRYQVSNQNAFRLALDLNDIVMRKSFKLICSNFTSNKKVFWLSYQVVNLPNRPTNYDAIALVGVRCNHFAEVVVSGRLDSYGWLVFNGYMAVAISDLEICFDILYVKSALNSYLSDNGSFTGTANANFNFA